MRRSLLLVSLMFLVIFISTSYALNPPFFYPINIDYTQPELYLKNGEQTTLSAENNEIIDNEVAIKELNLEGVGKAFRWMKSKFTSRHLGGAYVGRININDIFKNKNLSGCHDHGIMLAGILREQGYPVVMVEAVGIQWAEEYLKGRTSFSGHVFLEIFIDGKWMLLDSTSGDYILDYDYNHPVIPITKKVERLGYFVLLKGLDPADFGIKSASSLQSKMAKCARFLKKTELNYPPYSIKFFSTY